MYCNNTEVYSKKHTHEIRVALLVIESTPIIKTSEENDSFILEYYDLRRPSKINRTTLKKIGFISI